MASKFLPGNWIPPDKTANPYQTVAPLKQVIKFVSHDAKFERGNFEPQETQNPYIDSQTYQQQSDTRLGGQFNNFPQLESGNIRTNKGFGLYLHLGYACKLFLDAGLKVQFILLLVGKTGSLKTTLCETFAESFNEGTMLRFESTAVALENYREECIDMTMVVDDIFKKDSSSMKNWRLSIEFSAMVSAGQNRPGKIDRQIATEMLFSSVKLLPAKNLQLSADLKAISRLTRRLTPKTARHFTTALQVLCVC